MSDRVYVALTVIGAPAPYIVRTALALVVVAALVASATVASADALPDEPLYGVKVASEQMRLALASSPEDRAAVWLSMAEHRLAEAERLALAGREPEALVAASAYGTQLAEAAAELAAIERVQAKGPSVVQRLKERLAQQQARATDIAELLRQGAANARSAPAFDTVASAPPAEASGTLSELIAEHAAAVTDQVAAVAEQRSAEVAAEAPSAPPPPAPAAEPTRPAPRAAPQQPRQQPQRQEAPSAAPQGIGNVNVPDAQPTATASPSATPRAAGDDGLSEIARKWKAQLEKIKENAAKAKEAVKAAKERAAGKSASEAGDEAADPRRGQGAEKDD